MNAEQAKAAAAKAVGFVRDLYSSETVVNLSVEEIELTDSGKEWFITIGFDRPVDIRSVQAQLANALGQDPPMEREYKRVEVRAETLDVVRMTLREPVP